MTRQRIAREGFDVQNGFYFDPGSIQFPMLEGFVIYNDLNSKDVVGIATDVVRELNGDITADIKPLSNQTTEIKYLSLVGTDVEYERSDMEKDKLVCVVSKIRLLSLITVDEDPWEEA